MMSETLKEKQKGLFLIEVKCGRHMLLLLIIGILERLI